jgi:hypothetical protein
MLELKSSKLLSSIKNSKISTLPLSSSKKKSAAGSEMKLKDE